MPTTNVLRAPILRVDGLGLVGLAHPTGPARDAIRTPRQPLRTASICD
jgi:hypothetical protein